MSYGVKYGAKNDGPKIVPVAGDKEAAKTFADSVGGRVVELDGDGKEKRASRPAPAAPTGDK